MSQQWRWQPARLLLQFCNKHVNAYSIYNIYIYYITYIYSICDIWHVLALLYLFALSEKKTHPQYVWRMGNQAAAAEASKGLSNMCETALRDIVRQLCGQS